MITLTCSFCGKKYRVYPYKKDGKYCSEECYHEASRGRVPWNAGKKLGHLSDEHKRKVGLSLKGRQFSDEHKKKLSEAATGKHHTEKTKKKISTSLKKWYAGSDGKEQLRKWSENQERKENLKRMTMLSHTPEKTRQLIKEEIYPFQNPEIKARALKASMETQRQKLEAGIHPFQNPEVRAKTLEITMKRNRKRLKEGTHPFQDPEVIIKTRIALGKKNNGGTQIEKKIGRLLDEMGLEKEAQKPVPGGHDVWGRQRYLFPDFFLPKSNSLIECDGEYWHQDKGKESPADA